MNAIVRRDPRPGIGNVRRLMDRLFEDPFIGFNRFSNLVDRSNPVPLDVAISEEKVVVTASLPGVKPEDVKVSIEDNLLTIEGDVNTSQESEGENGRYILKERHSGAFQRSLPLPQGLEQDAIEAEFKGGVLTVTVPRIAPKSNVKTIQVKTA